MITTKERSGFSWMTEATQYEHAQAGYQESLNGLLAQHEGLVRNAVHCLQAGRE